VVDRICLEPQETQPTEEKELSLSGTPQTTRMRPPLDHLQLRPLAATEFMFLTTQEQSNGTNPWLILQTLTNLELF